MKSNLKLWASLALLVMIALAVVAFSPAGAGIRAKLMCFTEAGNCVEGWNGTDLALYSDAGSTSTFNVEGANGAVRIVPTAIGTATPAFVIRQGGGSNAFELRNASETPEAQLNATRLDLNDTYIDQDQDTENIGLPTILSVPITYTAAAGGSGTVATIADGEIWLIHDVFIRVTTNFDATGDDATFVVGDGNDADGFIVAADAQLQATFTEATGYAAGWYGIENGSNGAYTVDDGGPFVYAPSGAAETIDYVIDETSGETLSAGALTVYVVYTRIQ